MKPYYLVDSTRTLFVAVHISENSLKILRGHIGRPCLVFQISSDRNDILKRKHQSIKDAFLEKGYQEETRPDDITEGSKAAILRKPEIMSNPSYAQLMEMSYMEDDYKDKNLVAAHFPDGLSYEGDLNMGLLCDSWGFSAVIVEGEVDINGVFYDLGDAPRALLFLGDVKAKSFVKEFCDILIDGGLIVEQTVYGDQNDGSLKITGDVRGEAWVSNNHQMFAEGEYYIHRADIFNEGTPDWIKSVFFQSEDEDGDFDRETFLKYILEGSSVLQEGVGLFVPEESANPITDSVGEKAVRAEPQFDPELTAQLEPFLMASDNMGITQTLLQWKKRDEGWSQLVESRLSAPSISDEEVKLLKSALSEYKPRLMR